MITVLLLLHLIIALVLVGVVLVQRSEGGALGIGGGGGFMTGRGAANFMTRVTAGLAAAFFTTSLLLTLLATRPVANRSIFDTPAPATGGPASTSQPGDQTGQPAAPAQTPGRGGILDKLGPATPEGPRLPQSK
jgi:preprotein translocase subunit SecG